MSVYREEILEHYSDPQNFGKLEECDISSKQTNPFCGDDIEVFVTFNKGYKVHEISFVGMGCAISIASASMLTEFAKGKTVDELTGFSEEDMIRLLGVEVSETRKKCALLARATLRDCLKI